MAEKKKAAPKKKESPEQYAARKKKSREAWKKKYPDGRKVLSASERKVYNDRKAKIRAKKEEAIAKAAK